MHMYSTFQITENGKQELSLWKNLHLWHFSTFHFTSWQIHLSNRKYTCTVLSKLPRMENNTYPLRNTYTLGFFSTFHFPIWRLHLSNGNCTCEVFSKPLRTENKNYPSRKTYTFSFFLLSIFQFAESTYPTEKAHIEDFPNHWERKIRLIPREKHTPLVFVDFPFSNLPNLHILQKMHT